MLQRVSADRFSTPAGQKVQLVLRSSRNNGTNGGEFHYAGRPLDPEVIQALPGCTFVPVAGVEQFRVNVDFDPDSPNARYDLFEVDQANGAQVDLNERRLASDNDGVIGFGIVGAAIAVASAGKRAARGLPPPARKAMSGKKTAAPKKKAAGKKPAGKSTAQADQKKRRSAVKKKPVARPAKRRKPSSQAKRSTPGKRK